MSTESTLPRCKIIECELKLLVIEIRPVTIGKIQFCIGELPQEEIADAMFPAGPNTEIRVRIHAETGVIVQYLAIDIGLFQIARIHVIYESLRGIGNIPSATIIGGDYYRGACVFFRQLLHFTHIVLQFLGEAGAITNELQAYIILVQLIDFIPF